MKTSKRVTIIEPKAEFARGFVEGEVGADFLRLVLPMSEGSYDYSNWTRRDLEELVEAIDWLLEETEPKEDRE